MLFHEIYGTYFRTLARILNEAGNKGITGQDIRRIVAQEAFAESVTVIPDKLADDSWPVLVREENADIFTSLLQNQFKRPLTLIEKQWLKAILSDRRFRLFLYKDDEKVWEESLRSSLTDIPALFDVNDFIYYDRYTDGDDYEDPDYIANFHKIIKAMDEKRMLFIKYTGARGKEHGGLYYPFRIEYSSKDDKFRMLCRSRIGKPYTINISRINYCEVKREAKSEEREMPSSDDTAVVELLLIDERNALERAMLAFSDLQKETEKIDDRNYNIKLTYYKDDETEILIRVLSFGPLLRVTGPVHFMGLIKKRIEKQENLCGL